MHFSQTWVWWAKLNLVFNLFWNYYYSLQKVLLCTISLMDYHEKLLFDYYLMTRTMPIEWMLKNNIFIASSNWYVQQPTKWLMIANHYRYSQCIFDYGSFKFSFNETSTAYITFSWTLHFFLIFSTNTINTIVK